MKTSVKDAGKVKVVGCEGKLYLGNGDEDLAKAIKSVLGEGHKKVVLDLSGVTAMDSAGLGEVVACKKRALDQKAEVRVVIPQTSKIPLHVQTCIRLAFDVAEDVTKASGSF
jgi:anti-anti-sigma factor